MRMCGERSTTASGSPVCASSPRARDCARWQWMAPVGFPTERRRFPSSCASPAPEATAVSRMARAPRSFLLEQLRAQADAVAAKRVQQLKLSREVVDRIDHRVHAVFQYFDEACKLLQVISPPIERS